MHHSSLLGMYKQLFADEVAQLTNKKQKSVSNLDSELVFSPLSAKKEKVETFFFFLQQPWMFLFRNSSSTWLESVGSEVLPRWHLRQETCWSSAFVACRLLPRSFSAEAPGARGLFFRSSCLVGGYFSVAWEPLIRSCGAKWDKQQTEAICGWWEAPLRASWKAFVVLHVYLFSSTPTPFCLEPFWCENPHGRRNKCTFPVENVQIIFVCAFSWALCSVGQSIWCVRLI